MKGLYGSIGLSSVLRYMWRGALIASFCISLLLPTVASAWTEGAGWGHVHRLLDIGNMWDMARNDNYGGYGNAFTWPGAWDINNNEERRTYANYKGMVIGAKNVHQPEFPDVIWPYMVAQRDGRNDGEKGESIITTPPNPLLLEENSSVQMMFHGRLSRKTFRQGYATVTVDGVENVFMIHNSWAGQTLELVGDEDDGPYQNDAIDPTIPADMVFDSQPWTRMGLANRRRIYIFVDRDNDDYMLWHWSIINNGLWGRLGVDRVDELPGAVHGTVQEVMLSLMAQWDRSSRGAWLTNSVGEGNNDSIWNYYGADYDGAKTEDMRLVWVRDGDQDVSKFAAYANGSTDDHGDPDPLTGELLSAKVGGLQILHYDQSTTDRRDDPAQPVTVGWTNYMNLLQTSRDGHEAKYNQMRYGYQKGEGYYDGPYQTTSGRGTHPLGGSWIKASNDPAVSEQYWPGKVLGVDIEVTDVEQQIAFGPDDIPAYDTLNGIWAYAVNGVDMPTCQNVGAQWLAGQATDQEKNALVFSAKDSLFDTMRQAKAVYESATFADGVGGQRQASTREEFEASLGAAVDAGILALSPPAPAAFIVQSGPGRGELAWTLNTTTGSDIAGWRVYRAHGSYKGDSMFATIAELSSDVLWYHDLEVVVGEPYYYYLTTFDAEGHESTMHTRTSDPMIATKPTSVGEADAPDLYVLGQNVPNPFNASTTIRFSVPHEGDGKREVRLDVYSPDGRLIRTLVSGMAGSGQHEVVWDATDSRGKPVGSGTYLYRLDVGDKVGIKRMTLVR